MSNSREVPDIKEQLDHLAHNGSMGKRSYILIKARDRIAELEAERDTLKAALTKMP